MEIKSSATFNASFLKNIKYFQKLSKGKSPIGFLIYAGEQEQKLGDIQVINYKNIHKIMTLIAQY